ncbi:MAG: hypothetical protein ABN488_02990 [Methylobacteriaceae bacterium]
MGWRARDREERARSRAVPVIERWALERLAAIGAGVAAVAAALWWTA